MSEGRHQSVAAVVGLLSCLLSSSALALNLGATQDNTLCEDVAGALSNGAGQYLFIGVIDPSGGSLKRRGLIQFDIASQIPAGAVIQSASLTLHMSRTIAAAFPASLHPMQRAWGEGSSDPAGQEGGCELAQQPDATWLFSTFSTTRWLVPGGDFALTPSATQSIDGVGFYTWSSTPAMVADVQSWLDSPATNFGWAVLGDETTTTTAKRFDTRESPDASKGPRLAVDFTFAGPIVYGSIDPTAVVVVGNEVGAGFSPVAVAATLDPLVFYQVDDGTGFPSSIHMVKSPTGMQVIF